MWSKINRSHVEARPLRCALRFCQKHPCIDYFLLLVLSIAPVSRAGFNGILSPVDVQYSFYPLEEVGRYSYMWFEPNNGFCYIPAHMSQLPLLGFSALLHIFGFPLWLIDRLWFVIPVFLIGLSAYYFASSIISGKQKRLIAVIASVLFISNFYIVAIVSIGGIRELLSVAFTILSLSLFIRGIMTKQSKYIVLLGISSMFSVGVVPYAVIGAVLASMFAVAYLFIVPVKRKSTIRFVFLSALTCLLLNLWWLLPLLTSYTGQIYHGDWGKQLPWATLPLSQTIMLKNAIPAIPVNEIQFTALTNIAGLLFAILAFASLLLKKHRGITICVSFITLILLLFALGATSSPLGFIYTWFYKHVPFFEVFRNPMKFTAYVALFYSVLSAVLLATVIDRTKYVNHLRRLIRIVGLSCVVLLILFMGVTNSYPLFSGNMGGALKPFELPKDYEDLHCYLDNENEDASMLVLPMPYWFSEFTWHDDMNHITNPIRTVSPMPIIYDDIHEINLNELQKELSHQFYDSSDGEYKNNEIANLLCLLNVGYVLLQNDETREIEGMSPGTNPIVLERIRSYLNHDSHIHLEDSFGELDLYETDEEYLLPHVYPVSNVSLVNGGTDEMFEVVSSDSFTPGEAVLFLSEQVISSQSEFIQEYSAGSSSHAPEISFEKVNATKYQVKVTNVTEPFFLAFSQSYHPQWKAYVNSQGEETNWMEAFFQESIPSESHFISNGYANAWYIDPGKLGTGAEFSITLYFQPQSSFYLGWIISGLTFAGCIGLLVWCWRRGRRLKTRD